MSRTNFISTTELYWRKMQGCYREFGLAETVRRMRREAIRPLSRSKHTLDISLLTENVSVGAAPRSFAALGLLKEAGFRDIVDLRAERSKSDVLAKTRKMLVHWLPIHDDWRPKPPDFFQSLTAAINGILSKDDARLFLCCSAGEHRAPLAGALALVIMGHSLESAVMTVQQSRPVAELLPAYLLSLGQFLDLCPLHKS